MVHPLDIPEIALHVGQCISLKDLSSCILVSQRWHHAFLLTLWKAISWKKLEPRGLRGPAIDGLDRHRYFVHNLCLVDLSQAMDEAIQAIDFPHLRGLRIFNRSHESQSGRTFLGLPSTMEFLKRHQHSLQELTLAFEELGTFDPKQQPTFRPSQTQMIGALATATLNDSRAENGCEDEQAGQESEEERDSGRECREIEPPLQLLRALTLKEARIDLEEMDSSQDLWGLLRRLSSLTIANWICTPVDTSSYPTLGTWISPSAPLESPPPSPSTAATPAFSNMEGTQLRHLCLQGGNITTCMHEVTLIHQCQALQSLTWHNSQFKVQPRSILSRFKVEGQWPLLNSLDLGIPGLDGQSLSTIIDSLNRPLKKLAIHCHISGIVSACEVLLQSGQERHQRSLEILHLPYAKDVVGPLVHRILCSFTHLKSFHIVGGIKNTDFSKVEGEGYEAIVRRPWACQGLEDFRMILFPNLSPRLMAFYENLSGNGDEHWREASEQYRSMLDRLEALPKLETLVLGHRSCAHINEPHHTVRETHFKSAGWKMCWSQDNIQPISMKHCGWGGVYNSPGR
ncbi:hypothetical protein EMPS_03829 [Entomortierella parvispora]|uniref:F-box domain-containing protein n=1 Tax=Entomortierella parvispora TaxID=205924 RepID=A0A9P3H7H0_9FUNG|nr:hypothetical protein EMPS_03829 [Entomortierella parvispora]